MNFSSLAGCLLACRFSHIKALKQKPVDKPTDSKGFVYNSMLESSYKKIIEGYLPQGSCIMFGDANGKFTFSYRGIKESIHAVAVIDNEPYLVKVILVGEPVIRETLPIKYNSAVVSSQALMALSSQTGNSQINKTMLICVETNNYCVTNIVIEADKTEQENIKNQIDFVLATDSERIQKVESKHCETCNYSDICENKTLPVVACSTCAFYSDNEVKQCGLGNNVGVKCPQHIYNPILLVNHKESKVDVQNLYVEYDAFINCNNDMGFKPSLTSDEMFTQHRFDNDKILDKNLHQFQRAFGAKIINKED